MSCPYDEGRIRFTFPENWAIFRPQKSAYYKRRFQNFCGSCKEMDFIGWEPNERTLWLLEVKDYTTNRREKSLNIDDEIATKVRDTLAFLLGASAMAAPDSAKTDAFATSCLPPKKIRVVLHLEQPCKPSKLFPRIKNIADMTQLLRRKLRCIDAHPKVVSLIHPATLPWKAEWCP